MESSRTRPFLLLTRCVVMAGVVMLLAQTARADGMGCSDRAGRLWCFTVQGDGVPKNCVSTEGGGCRLLYSAVGDESRTAVAVLRVTTLSFANDAHSRRVENSALHTATEMQPDEVASRHLASAGLHQASLRREAAVLAAGRNFRIEGELLGLAKGVSLQVQVGGGPAVTARIVDGAGLAGDAPKLVIPLGDAGVLQDPVSRRILVLQTAAGVEGEEVTARRW